VMMALIDGAEACGLIVEYGDPASSRPSTAVCAPA